MTAQTMLRLRPYQQECLDALEASWKEVQRPAAVLATGLGKSVIFSHLARQHIGRNFGRVVILVHRDELADQALDKLRSVAPGLRAGKVKAGDNDVTADVMVCSVQTLAREARIGQLLAAQERAGRVGLVIVDECFPAGTLVGGTPIEKLQPGDLVPTWNETTGREEVRPVVRTMRKTPSAMVRVILRDGSSFTCTPNHPILTSQGWCPAGMLTRDAFTVSFTHDAKASERDLYRVRGGGNPGHQGEDRHFPVQRENLLLRHLPGHLGPSGRLGAHGPDEPGPRFGTDAPEQSDASSGASGKDDRDPAQDRAQTPAARRERLRADRPSAPACGIPGMADGGRGGSRGRGAALSLQDGHRSSFDEGVRGGGRGIPLLAGAPSLRPEEGRTAVLTRVADVQILEPGRDGTYGGVCPDGAVYNIEVDATHTYLIGEGTVVHNCHHALAVSYRNVMAALGCYSGEQTRVAGAYDVRAVGFTATLARGDGQGLGDVWQEVPFVRSVLWGVRNGFLTDVRAHQVDLEGLDLSQVKRSGGDYTAKSLGEALMEADVPRAVHQCLVQYAPDRRSIIVFTPTVAVAAAVTEHLKKEGVPAGYVHGGTPRPDRLKLYERFRRGEVRVLVNCMVLTEGADFPFADCAVIARPTRSDTLFIQMAGRVLRPSPHTGKTDALLLLLAGGNASIRTLIDLDPSVIVPAADGESLGEAHERQEKIREELEAKRSRREAAVPRALRLTSKAVDLFASSPSYQWLRTARGIQFIPLGTNGEVLLWPSRDEEGLWDVVWAPPSARWERLHTALALEPAMAWGESEAEERSDLNTSKSASWRKKAASDAQVRFARQFRRDVTPDMRAGEVGDIISTGLASRKIDRFVPRS